MSTFFTSDWHFGHANIIKYSNRPFADKYEMDRSIIVSHNSVVQPEDTVYFLGDIGFSDYQYVAKVINRLNGIIHLVKGNHDNKLLKHSEVRSRFASVNDLLEVTIPDQQGHRGGQKIVLCHYAMRVWNKSHHGSWQLYGHSHGSLAELRNSLQFDVGVDSHSFFPWSYEEVKAKMKTKEFQPIDHHGA